jgi:hypothetical protein
LIGECLLTPEKAALYTTALSHFPSNCASSFMNKWWIIIGGLFLLLEVAGVLLYLVAGTLAADRSLKEKAR